MSIFDFVGELLDSRSHVPSGNAVDIHGALYDDVAEDCVKLLALEVSLHGLIQDAQAAGLQSKALQEVIELLDPDKDYLENNQ
jgi:hypothetical protein